MGEVLQGTQAPGSFTPTEQLYKTIDQAKTKLCDAIRSASSFEDFIVEIMDNMGDRGGVVIQAVKEARAKADDSKPNP